jgi:hypothetical protein
MDNYMQSKVGGLLLANEFTERLGESEVMSVVSYSVVLKYW